LSRDLDALAPASVASVLESLSALSARVRAGLPIERPLVTLHLRSGRDLTGAVLAVADERLRGAQVLLHVAGTSRAAEEVVFVAVAEVEALRLHDARALDAAPKAGDVPTPLEAKRRAAALGKSIGEIVGAAIEVELQGTADALLEPLGALLAQVDEVMRAVAKDDMGREAVRTKIARVRLTVREATGVELRDKVLTITTTQGGIKRWTVEGLRAAIEGVL
jgi:hypothetical protein